MSMKTRDLLVEIGTEELPPKVLQKLSQSFSDFLVKDLNNDALLEDNSITESYASPRRLSLLITKVRECAPDRPFEEKGPSVKVGIDKNNNPTKALIGFANRWDVDISQLERQETPKGEFFFYKHIASGSYLKTNLDLKIESALRQLPIPKRMRWGSGTAEFVRPVHWIVVLFGNETIECEIMGIQSGNLTYGHRYHYPVPVEIKSASDYVHTLQRVKVFLNGKDGKLNNEISQQVNNLAKEINGIPLNSETESDLVAEIAALVEWPVAISGKFDPKFLTLPEEILIATLEDQQRYFPVRDKKTGKLLPHFITVANIESKDINQVRHGNERVIVPRLTDAMFFWDTDRAVTLESRIPALDGIIFQNKLGTIGDKMRRVTKLAKSISNSISGDPKLAERAAQLAKCDLVTSLVGEFPELQGTIGRYLAQHDGEPDEVAKAIEEHYLPRYADDRLPTTRTGQALAIADKLDTMMGIFAIGQIPTGEKDPFALRRAALGILRILIECDLDIDLYELLKIAAVNFNDSIKAPDATSAVFDFIMDRLRSYLRERNYAPDEIDAVLSLNPTQLDHILPRLDALKMFRALPEGMALAAANKRIQNILRQAGNGEIDVITPAIDSSLLVEEAEKTLCKQLVYIAKKVHPLTAAGDYATALKELAQLRDSVDTFFDKVMVMTEDEMLRTARLQLLAEIHREFQAIADVSKLQG